MIRLLLSAIMCITLAAPVHSQALKILWQQCYGGNHDDDGISVLPTTSGYILIGMSSSTSGQVSGNYGDTDLWVVHIDSSGNYLGSDDYGGSQFDVASLMKACPDGGFLIGGTPFSSDGNVPGNHGGSDYWLIKLNASGNLQWQKCYGGSCNDNISDVAVTPDSGFLCIGWSCSSDGNVSGHHGFYDYWLIRTDKQGDLKWEKSFGGSSQDNGLGVAATRDGGCIITGWTGSTDGDVQCTHYSELDAWVLKLDSNAGIQWQKCYGGDQTDAIMRIVENDDGTYMFLGSSNSYYGPVHGNHGGYDFWIGKLDHWGNLIWNRCYGGGGDEAPAFFKKCPDGNFIAGGITRSYDGDVKGNHSNGMYSDGWIIKVDTSGNLLWQQCFGGVSEDGLSDALILPGNRYLLIGTSRTQNNSGNVNCTHHTDFTDDLWLIMVQDSTLTAIPDMTGPGSLLTVSPNPADHTVAFSSADHEENWNIRIADQLGKTIGLVSLKPHENRAEWDSRHACDGLYYFYLESSEKSIRGKILISHPH